MSGSDITESVYASGKVKAIDQYNVYSTVNGVLQNIVWENVFFKIEKRKTVAKVTFCGRQADLNGGYWKKLLPSLDQ